MFKLISSETVPLTNEIVQKFLDMQPSPTERTLDIKRVKHLKDKAEAGYLVPFNWSCAKVNGKIVRMNGQHSSVMLNDLDDNLPKGLKVHLDTYEVDDTDGLALLFRQFDDRKSSRSPLDVSGAYQGLEKDLDNVPRASAQVAVQGVTWFRRSIEGFPVKSGDDIYDAFHQKALHKYIKYVGRLLTSKTRELKRVQILSALYATHSANEKVSVEFWNTVAKGGDEYSPESPTTVLAKWLQNAFDKEMKKAPKAAEYYNACIYAWNAYRANRDIRMINIKAIKSNLTADS